MENRSELRKVKIPNRKIKIFLTLFGTLASTIALTIVTFSWFATIRKAGIENDTVQVVDTYAHSFSCALDGVAVVGDVVEFTPFYPGHVHRKTLTFTLTNLSDDAFSADLFFEQPSTLEEIPYVDTTGKWGAENYYYYLGSQISLTSISLLIDGVTPSYTSGAGQYLVQTSSAGVTKGQVNGVASAVTSIPRLNIIKNVSIPSNKTLNGTLEFTFVDNGTDQSMYFVDWPQEGVSQRLLYAFLHQGV
jgi:hypothetical protein